MSNRRIVYTSPIGTKLQDLLDEGDAAFFARNPHEPQRIRFYFRGERVESGDQPGRYVIVSRRQDDTLVRRFLAETAGVR